MIEVEICYAGPEGQFLIVVRVPDGTTIGEAIDASGIRERVPHVAIDDRNVGIFSQLRPLSTKVEAGDRIEIYRALIADPKAVRRERAARDPIRKRTS